MIFISMASHLASAYGPSEMVHYINKHETEMNY